MSFNNKPKNGAPKPTDLILKNAKAQINAQRRMNDQKPEGDQTFDERAANLAPNKDPVVIAKNVDERIKSKAIHKIFGKMGKILKVETLPIQGQAPNYRIEFDNAQDATYCMKKLQGRVALDKKLLLAYETDSRGPSEEQKMQAISNKLNMLEKGIEHTDTVGKIFTPKNRHVFNRQGTSAPVFNGLGTTRTKQSTTLFVSNIPYHVQNSANLGEIMTKTFEKDPGFFSVRIVRVMCFVDYHSVQDATKAMVEHQNQRLTGASMHRMGLVLDYDKDSRSKRNGAYEKSRKDSKYSVKK